LWIIGQSIFKKNIQCCIITLSRINQLKEKIKKIIEIIIGLYSIVKRYHGFRKFIKKYLELPNKSKFINGDGIFENYDVVIYGGDQIWRKQLYETFKGFDQVYFAKNNISARHISYAASMGIIDVNDIELENLKNWMSRFEKIMVREKDLNDLVTSLGYCSEIVVDPVFLIEQERWDAISKKSKIKNKYILFHHHNFSKEAERLVKKLHNYYGYEIKIIRPLVYPLRIGKDEVQTATPQEFLMLYRNAEFVVSTSFHGVAFSIIFNKQFFALGMGKNSERVKTLLSTLHISDRYLENVETVDLSLKIDYEKIIDKLNGNIKESKKRLLDSIEIR
jgi:hypothetical protein